MVKKNSQMYITARIDDPKFPGQERFKGFIIHSHDYNEPSKFVDMTVVSVGVGNSGGDLAVELSRNAKRVYLSTRSGSWILDRSGKHGLPLDHSATRLQSWIHSGAATVNRAEKAAVERWGDLEQYGLKPKHRIFAAHPTVNSDLIPRIQSGHIVAKPNIREITEDTVIFEDGSSVKPDGIFYCTGYHIQWPFLDDSVLSVVDNDVHNTFRYIFPVGAKNIAMIGLFQPLGALMPVSELQARWVAQVFKGEQKLPSEEEQLREATDRRATTSLHYIKRMRHTIQVNVRPYMDSLAREIGCMPNFWRIFLMDPLFWWRLVNAPHTPTQYRIEGPNKWDGAKQAIIDMLDNVFTASMTRRTTNTPRRLPFADAVALSSL